MGQTAATAVHSGNSGNLAWQPDWSLSPYSLWEPPAMVQKQPICIRFLILRGFATTTVPATVSRTIVASASGWVEHFGTTEAIACDVINPGFGQCLNIDTTSVTANSGLPTPLVLPISTSTPVLSLSSTPFVSVPSTRNVIPTPTASPTNNQDQSAGTSVGAIAGGVVGGIAAFAILLTLLFCLRRRRQRSIDQEVAPRAYDPSIVPSDRFNNGTSGFERPVSYFGSSQLGSTASSPPSLSGATTNSSRNPANIRRNEKNLGNRGVGSSLPSDLSASELAATIPPPVYET
ncbi:hypothetical protein B0H13DRAFT_1915798 [Mycena leptocephala]|nr:hypothetical protein B0H13DRAFT_1915798 [Mycena leptocephala]